MTRIGKTEQFIAVVTQYNDTSCCWHVRHRSFVWRSFRRVEPGVDFSKQRHLCNWMRPTLKLKHSASQFWCLASDFAGCQYTFISEIGKRDTIQSYVRTNFRLCRVLLSTELCFNCNLAFRRPMARACNVAECGLRVQTLAIWTRLKPRDFRHITMCKLSSIQAFCWRHCLNLIRSC